MKRNTQFWWLEPEDRFLYVLDLTDNCWKNKTEIKKPKNYEDNIPCRSYKSAKRYLKKHQEIPKGKKFILVSKFVGNDRILYKK